MGLRPWEGRRRPAAGRARLRHQRAGRTDVPVDQPWETALHEAAGTGNVELARTLLDLGADPAIKDARFGATPLGWAHHFGQQATAELLESRTT